MRIGVDFDNTLVSYDEAFCAVAHEQGLLTADFRGDKVAVKSALIAAREDGLLWEALQGLVYGRFIDHATLFSGAREFLTRCGQSNDVEVFVVSHKTELAHHDPLGTNLRTAALGWMRERRLFELPGFDPTRVFFEDTREGKIRRIAALECDVFIDDLDVVLEHPLMPAQCRRILFRGRPQTRLEQYQNWNEISDALLSDI